MIEVEIKHPQKLRFLATDGLFNGTLDYSKFTSLEKISTVCVDLRSISAGFIEKLPSLRELHFDLPYYYSGFEDHHLLEPSLSSQATARIFHYGFEISLDQINRRRELPRYYNLNFDPTVFATEYIIRNRYNSIENNPSVGSILYNQLASELDDSEMFSLIPQKFPKIRRLHLTGSIADECRLLKFMGQFKITVLSFERTALSQSFFKKLVENHTFIQTLSIKLEPTMSILSGDFDFILQLKNLNYIYLRDCPLSLNIVARVLQELKQLRQILFEQLGQFRFYLLVEESHVRIDFNSNGLGDLELKILTEEAPNFINTLSKRVKADGSVCLKALHSSLRRKAYEDWLKPFRDHKLLAFFTFCLIPIPASLFLLFLLWIFYNDLKYRILSRFFF